jgi:cytochrome b subunit of formate dehydrogenase
MVRLAGHAGAAVPGTGGAAALLVAALLPGLLAALPFTSRGGEAGAPARSWITSIPRIPRYSVAQRIQHFLAFALFLALFASAAARAVAPGPLSHAVHVRAGEGAAILLLLHLAYLVQKAVRLDLPVSEVALLPFADAEEGEGKYSRSERWDYLLLVTFALLLAVTGILLRWPGSAGLSPKGYGAVRLVHLFFGAVAAVHLVAGHARLRLLRGGEGSALSIVTGSVPLATAEGRPGWIRRLVEAGTLVPVPEEKGPTAESREGTLVRELLEEGNRLARGGDFGGARRKFAEALVHYPEYSQARFNLAVACMKGGDREEAAAHFAAFLEADPFNPVAEKAREYLEACRKEGTS